MSYTTDLPFPSCIDYSETHYSLPQETTAYAPFSVIQVDLASDGFIEPDSIYIRYKTTIANAAAALMCGCPIYTPFNRLDVLLIYL